MHGPEQVEGALNAGPGLGGWRDAGGGGQRGGAGVCAGRGGCGELSPERWWRPGPGGAVPRRGPTRRTLGKCVDPGRWAVSRSTASPSPRLPTPPREGRFPLDRRLGGAGSRAFVCGNPLPGPAPLRSASGLRLGLRGAGGAGRGAGRAAAALDMSGPRAGFYRQELNKTVWEVPQRLQGLRPVGSGAYGSVW